MGFTGGLTGAIGEKWGREEVISGGRRQGHPWGMCRHHRAEHGDLGRESLERLVSQARSPAQQVDESEFLGAGPQGSKAVLEQGRDTAAGKQCRSGRAQAGPRGQDKRIVFSRLCLPPHNFTSALSSDGLQ